MARVVEVAPRRPDKVTVAVLLGHGDGTPEAQRPRDVQGGAPDTRDCRLPDHGAREAERRGIATVAALASPLWYAAHFGSGFAMVERTVVGSMPPVPPDVVAGSDP